MRRLILVLALPLFFLNSNLLAEGKCAPQGFDTKSLQKKMTNLSEALPKATDGKSKKKQVQNFLEEVNCELDRTTQLPLDDEYRWLLSDYHSILTDLTSGTDCKKLETKVAFNETNQGTFSEDPMQTRHTELAKKLAKGFCQSSK